LLLEPTVWAADLGTSAEFLHPDFLKKNNKKRKSAAAHTMFLQ
jgi:hypothetical protein